MADYTEVTPGRGMPSPKVEAYGFDVTDLFLRDRDSLGTNEALRLARKQAAEWAIVGAETVDDLKVILREIVERSRNV